MEKQEIRIDFVNLVEAPDESISYPLGILYISATLKQNGFTTIGFTEHVCLLRKIHGKEEGNSLLYTMERYQEIQKDNQEKVLNYLIERKPQLLLLGPITSHHLVELQYIIEKIRQHLPDAVLLVGGPHFGKELELDVEYLKNCSEIDAIIVGEAEETVNLIAQEFYDATKFEKISSSKEILSKRIGRIKGVLTNNNEFQPCDPPDLRALPLPDIKLLDDYWKGDHVSISYMYKLSTRRNPVVYTDYGYFQGEADWGSTEDDFHHFPFSWSSRFPYGIIVGSRGCPGNCTFCCSQGTRRIHPAQNIMDQIKYMNEKHKTRVFVFFESLFTTASQEELKRIEELCHMIIQSGLNINFMIDIRADILSLLSDEIIDLIIEAGCKEFNIGFEKGSDRALELVQKGTTTEQHYSAVKKVRESASRLGISVLVNGTFILGGPKETKKDIYDTITHSWLLHLDNVSIYPLEISPGTEIYKGAIREKVIQPNIAPYTNLEYYPIYETEDVPLAYMRSIVNSNSEARRRYSDFVKTMKEFEKHFDSNYYDLTNIILKETKQVRDIFQKYIDNIFLYQDEDSKRLKQIKDEINQVESNLIEHYQHLGKDVNDIQNGTILRSMESCLSSLDQISKMIQHY